MPTTQSAAINTLCLTCRAKLGEALERMDRVVQAIERDAVQPSPYTAPLPAHLQNEDADSVSPALQQASHLSSLALHATCRE